MSLTPGSRLGPYEILAPLGAGGMGEVYRARDTRLGRVVALKILPAEFAGNASRRQRFELEARAVAALNHPNIVAVYDVGEESGIPYMVSELVDGEPLRGSRFSLRRTLEIAVQIAGGLAAAHEAGIVHRDLKPDNILLTRDGRAKILDFGLARMTVMAPPGESAATVTACTEAGTVMGTVGYMSPEQVRGLPADHRTDIFSFGLILHEMVSGRRTFGGETSVEIMTAILKQDAPELPETVPAGIRQVVAHCLEKDPAGRFQSARDLAFALEMGQRGDGRSSPRRKIPSVLFLAAALGLVALGFVAYPLLTRAPEAPRWSGVRLGGPQFALNAVPSPDGHLLAFLALVDGLTQVAVMKQESGNWSLLTHRRDRGMVHYMCWSPDGSLIYFSRLTDVPQGVFSVPVLGGEEHLIVESAEEPTALPDGTLLGYRINAQRLWQLFRFWPDTGKLQDLPVVQKGTFDLFSNTTILPDGKHAIVGGMALGHDQWQSGFLELDITTARVRSLSASGYDASNVRVWTTSPDGKSIVLCTPAETLLRLVSIPIDGGAAPQTLFTVTSDVFDLHSGLDGSLYMTLVDRPVDLVRLSLTGAQPETIASFAQLPDIPMLAVLPDGRAVLPERVSGRDRLMAVESGKAPVPLVNTTEETTAPFAATGPHGIVFGIGPLRQTIAVADTSTGRITHRLSPAKGTISSVAVSADGGIVYFVAGGNVWAIEISGGESRKITTGDAVIADPAGRGLVIVRMESSRIRLYRIPPDGGPEQTIPVDSDAPLNNLFLSPGTVSKDGRMLLSLFVPDSWFNPPAILDMASGRVRRLAWNKLSDYPSLAWTADGGIVALQFGMQAKIWNFRPHRGKP